MRLALLMLAACGAPPTVTPKILPPNTEQACDRAIACEAVASMDRSQCVTCLEHVDPSLPVDEFLKQEPIETWECDELQKFVDERTNLPTCIAKHWGWEP